MSYNKIIEWKVIPKNLPVVKRNCPKCGNNCTFVSTNKFRVNGNKKNIDIWLIYQCDKCKSTWNMTIYERINPNDLEQEMLTRFEQNDTHLARYYSFNKAMHVKNKSVLVCDDIEYDIEGEYVNIDVPNSEEGILYQIIIKSEYDFDLRVDKLLSHKLGVSRSKIKKLYKMNRVYSVDTDNILKRKIRDDMIFVIAT